MRVPVLDLEGEIWKPVGLAEFADRYEVSTMGRVRNTGAHSVGRGAGYVTLRHPTLNRKGYLTVSLHADGYVRTHTIHKLVLTTFVGPRHDGQQCRHLNGDRTDNRLVNLAWGTMAENLADMERHGTRCRGETSPCARLTADSVLAMRRRYAAGECTWQQLADEHGVSKESIGAALTGDTWAHVPEALTKSAASQIARRNHHAAHKRRGRKRK